VVSAGFAVRPVEGVVVVRPITAAERPQWQQHIGSYHYLGACALIGESLCYVATVGGEWVALLGWAAAALRNRRAIAISAGIAAPRSGGCRWW